MPNGTVDSGFTDPFQVTARLLCKQDTKKRYWGQQFFQMERKFSVGPTEMSGLVKVNHLQRWSQIFRSDETEMALSI